MPKSKLKNEEPEEEPVRGVYGEGSVYQRKSDGRYVASIPIGGGKKKQEYYDTKREAERARRCMLQELEQGKLVLARDQLLGSYLMDWLEVQRTVVKETTYSMYYNYVRYRLIPMLGHVKLQRLTGDMVQKMYTVWVRERELEFSTIRLIHIILKKALQDAVKAKKIAYNPLQDVIPPRVEASSSMQVLTQDQARLLLEGAKTTYLYTPILLAVTTGMRRGEILALHWRDVDFEKGQLEIRYTLSYVTDHVTGHMKFVLGTPKSKSSRRVVRLPDFVMDVLKIHRDQQQQKRFSAERWMENDLVFCTRYGTYINPAALRADFHQLLRIIGLPDMKFHGLRHSAATILLSMGINPKVVQELLGHSSINITLGIYGHVMPSMHQDAMDRMDEIFRQEDDDDEDEEDE